MRGAEELVSALFRLVAVVLHCTPEDDGPLPVRDDILARRKENRVSTARKLTAALKKGKSKSNASKMGTVTS
ncbi:hypothetical protein EGO58_12070 [Limosilactobacillus reuteri]|nr:hypothetical protein EGO58_12070 [Limosilactobacillus reuteri]